MSALAAAVNTDTSSTGGILFRDATNNYLYISYNNVLTLISADPRGSSSGVGLSFDSAWTDNSYGTASAIESFAAERQSDGTFLLAIRNTYTQSNGATDINWNIYKVSGNGYLNYSDSTFTQSIASWESQFNQDLNLDSAIGIGNLPAASTDTTGSRLKRDSEKGLYIDKDGSDTTTNDILQIKDEWGNQVYLDYDNSWSDGINTWSSEQRAIAVEQQSDNSFLIAVKNTSSDSQSGPGSTSTNTNWNIYAIDESGTLDWMQASYTSSIARWESKFNQDLNGDNAIGLSASLISANSDTTGARLKRDQEKGLYIDDAGTIIAITDEWGGSPQFDNESSWSDAWSSGSWSQESIAVEKQADGSFLLAVRDSSTYNNSDQQTNWSIYEVDSTGVLNWNTAKWGTSVGKWESKFNQDLNGDGGIGISASLAAVNTDKTGDRLKKDIEGGLYIDVNNNGSTVLQIIDNYGGTPSFDNDGSYFDGINLNSWSQKAVAVEKDGSNFLLAVKDTNTYGGTTNTNWSVYQIDSSGTLDWGNASWGSITKWESKFNQDLNEDGSIGRAANLKTISTDKSGARLKKDIDNALYIDIDGDSSTTNDILEVSDTHGGSPTFDYENSWSDGTNTDSWKSQAYAVEQQSDGKYLLAVKETNTHNGSAKVNWVIHTLSSSGVMNWESSAYTTSISKWETQFQQDLNLDGSIGRPGGTGSLTRVSTDSIGSRLLTDADKGLYIDVAGDGTNIIEITDTYGGSPSFDESYNWSDGTTTHTWTQQAVAVERLNDGSFRLAVQDTNTHNGSVETNWTVHKISATGVIDWSSSSWGSIAKWEQSFQQDLNLDGSIGRSANLTPISTDTTGARLKRDSEEALFIDNNGTIIEISDPYGGSPRFDYSGSWSDGTNTSTWAQVSYAVEQTATGFILAVKNTDSYNSDTNTNWNIYSLDAQGTIDWSSSAWGSILKWESQFNQDLNEDGAIGLGGSLTTASTDETGALLKRDSENGLYIYDEALSTADNLLAIVDQYGGTPQFDHSHSWTDGINSSSWNQAAIAVDRQSNNTYKLAVRNTNTYNGTVQTDWSIYTISSSGALNWSDSTWYQDASEIPADWFAQDLNQLDSSNDRTSERADVLIGSNGTTSKSANSPVSVTSTQDISDGEITKASADIGTAAEIKPLTDLMDFRITIANSGDYGSIQSAKFKLSAGSSNLTYYKKDASTGKYYEFNYDSATGEGARFSKSNEALDYNDILTVFIRDNGKHDSNSALGIIDDPGFVGTVGTNTSSASSSGAPVSSSIGSASSGTTMPDTISPDALPVGPEDQETSFSEESVLDFTPETTVRTRQLDEPILIGSVAIQTAIVGTDQPDRITGSSSNDALVGGKGKDKLTGGKGSDLFIFNVPGEFGKSVADVITDFNPKQKDAFGIDSDSFNGISKITFKAASSRQAIKKLEESNKTFVYNSRNGQLFFNANGIEEGCGDDGGLFAILKGSPDLSKGDFSLV